MSLYEAADGILGTHVAWSEVEEEMQKALGTTAAFGDDKKATNISDMKGFMSRIALIEPHWVGVSDEEKKELPEKFVVKISSQLPFIEMTKLMKMDEENDYWGDERLNEMGKVTRMLHNREVDTYTLLLKENNPKILFTKIYALKKFTEDNNLKGYIISEFVEDLQSIGMHESIPADDLLPVVHAVATFSAMGQKLSDEQTRFAREADFLDIVFGQFLDENTIEKTEKMSRDCFPEEYTEKVEKMLKINRQFYTNIHFLPRLKQTCEFLGHPEVFTHSDLWSSNLLYTRSGEKINLKAIIDYQTVSFATPAQDVGRLFVSCLSTKDRREKVDFLLEEYYKTFVDELDGLEAPYSLQQLKDSYQLYFPLMTMMVLPGIAPILEHLDLPAEEKEKLKDAAFDKMVGLLEDVITTHESSLQKFPKYFEFTQN
uniref:CHK domain-containing protein n=1 Tax=Caenorhabditis japonica TaxID=281687 RepID=A0A8R1DQ31_CAEJA